MDNTVTNALIGNLTKNNREKPKKFSKDIILKEILEIQEEIWGERIVPSIKDVHYKDGVLTIITWDRTDKAVIIGKGLLIGKLREKYKYTKVRVVAHTDIVVKKIRIKEAIKACRRYQDLVNDNLKKFLKELEEVLKSYLKNDKIKRVFDGEYKVALALSGGSDSSGSLVLSKKLNLNPVALTVYYPMLIPNHVKRNIENVTKYLGVEHRYIEIDMKDIVEDVFRKRKHPCSDCSKRVKDTIINYCIENGFEVVIFGDLLSTGSQCIKVINRDLIRLNLPACFAKTKKEMAEYLSEIDFNFRYSCPFLMEVHRRYPSTAYYSIQRVCRENRAGVLEPSDAARSILKIIKNIRKGLKKYKK